MASRTRVVALALVLAAPACKETPRPRLDGRTIRLGSAALRTEGADAKLLADRDTTTGLDLSSGTAVRVELDHDVEVRAVKLHVSGELDVSGLGAGSVAGDASGAWARIALPEPVTGRSFTVVLAPKGARARLTELELWGAGLPEAPRDLELLARASADRSRRFENAIVVPGSVPAQTLDAASPCVRVSFGGFAPRAARRAYLVYEANVQRAVVLSRSLDGAAPVGGFWIDDTEDVRTIVDELDPERLTGSDEAQLCRPGDAGTEVAVQGARLLLLLDDGTEPWDRSTRPLLGAAADGDPRTAASLAAGRHDLVLDRPVSVDAAELRVAGAGAPSALVGVLEASGWTELPAVTLGEATDLGIAGRTIGAAHVTLGDAGAPATAVSELRLEGSGTGRRVAAPRIVITYPPLAPGEGVAIGERFGSRAYVAGWAESPSGPGRVEVGGARTGLDGAFGTGVDRPLDATGPWQVIVRATFPDGTELTRTIDFADDRAAEVQPTTATATASVAERFGRENATSWSEVDPENGGRVKLGTDVELDAPPGAVAGKTAIGITRKGAEVMPPLDPGMVNVTAPPHAAYRFLPKGQRFAKPVKVKLPYDPDLLPEGTAPEEIQTYYYDDAAERWEPLPRVEVSRDLRRVTSETTHFTFMINAVLVLPDHPGPVSFNPNSIKDLKASDPSSNVDLVEAPEANSTGTAQLAMPIRLPKARGAYQPALQLSYDSGAGNGWVGVGWTLPVSSVGIDTRFGVPFYDGSERYLLDGAPLVPVDDGHAAETCVDDTPGRRYYPRVERDFKRVLRCGADKTSYRFEVTDRNGTLFVYGADDGARLRSSRGSGEIGEWYLQRVVDLNGNLTVFGYDFDDPEKPAAAAPGERVVQHGERFVQAYLHTIEYGGRAARTGGEALAETIEAGPYRVELRSQLNGRSAHLVRPDVLSSARLGFKVVTRRRLGTISVSLRDAAGTHGIREYRLAYAEGDFRKSTLRKIQVFGAWEPGQAAQPFHEHGLEYWGAPDEDDATPFAAPQPWTFAEGSDDQPLSRSEQWGFGVHGFVGIGPIAPSSVNVGIRAGYNQSQSTTLSSFLDVNGDALPDRVRLGSSGADVRFNDGTGLLSAIAPESDPYAGRRLRNVPISTLGHSSSSSFNVALQARAGPFSASFGWTRFWSSSPDFLIDADGDGLVDILNAGTVLFNQPRNGALTPECTKPGTSPSTFCFAPSKWIRSLGAVPLEPDFTADLSGDPAAQAMANEIDEQLRPADALLEWLAPYDGAVEISGTLALLEGARALVDPAWDGIRLRVYKVTPIDDGSTITYQTEKLVEETKTIAEVVAPSPVAIPSTWVENGTRLYFVLSTLSSFPVEKPGPTPLEEVSFSPTVAYAYTCAEGWCGTPDHDRRDPTGARLYRFDAYEDFRLAGQPLSAVTVPYDGTIEITTTVHKRPSSDDVRLCIQKFGADQEIKDLPCRDRSGAFTVLRQVPLASTDAGPFDASYTGTVSVGEKLVFRAESDLALDPAAIDWDISGRMTTVCVQDAGCSTPTPEEAEALTFVGDAYLPMHLHVDPDRSWERLKSARPRARPVVPFVATEHGHLVLGNVVDTGGGHGDVIFTVRKRDAVVFKGALDQLPASMDLELWPGEHVFLEAHSERPFSLDWWVPGTCSGGDGGTYECPEYHTAWIPNAEFRGDSGSRSPGPPINVTVDAFTRLVNDEVAEMRILSPFGGGYHGWRYGVWGGPNDQDIQPELFEPSADDQDWSGGEDEAGLDSALDRMDGDNAGSADRLRAERVQPLVPRRAGTYFSKKKAGLKPRVPAYVSKDGNVFVTAGGMHAAREGGYVEPLDGGGSATSVAARFRMGRMSRASTGDNFHGGLGVLFAGLSVSGGHSRSKADVRDMNGDGIIDVVSAGGPGDGTVRVTHPRTLDQRTSFGFRDKVSLQENGDLSVSFNLGISDAVKTFAAAATPASTSTTAGSGGNSGQAGSAPPPGSGGGGGSSGGNNSVVGSMRAMYPGLSGGLGVNFSATKAELIDVNGDGLPDAVRRDPRAEGFWVRLNLGTDFAASEDWVPTGRWEEPALDLLVAKLGSGINGASSRRRGLVLGALRGGVYDAAADPNMVRRTTAISINDNLGAGFGERYQATVNWESSIAATGVSFTDVNGDGLPDWVRKGSRDTVMRVMLNTGYGFAPERAWHVPAWPAHVAKPWLRSKSWVPTMKTLLDWVVGPEPTVDAIEANGSYSAIPTVGFAFSFSIPIWVIRLHFTFGADVTPKKVAGFDLMLQDVNGDGLPDHVLKSEKLAGRDNGSVYARVNLLEKGNLLRGVQRPLGGRIELEYARKGGSVDLPGNRWVLSRVVRRDGRGNAAYGPLAEGHDLETRFRYEQGYYDRAEREFLGFRTVTREQADGTRVVRTYRNANFAVKGLLEREEVWSADDKLFTQTVNTYRPASYRAYDIPEDCLRTTPFFLDQEDYCHSFVVELDRTTTTRFEGLGQPRQVPPPEAGVSTTQVYLAYDRYGNVTSFHDAGDDSDPGDDVWSTVEYANDTDDDPADDEAFASYSVSRPRMVTLRSGPAETDPLLRARKGSYDDAGRLVAFTVNDTATTTVTTNLVWNRDYGTLREFWAPAVSGRRYVVRYEYDPVTHAYPTRTQDAHGYASTVAYDYRFGEPTDTTDVNGNVTRRVLDRFGRLRELFGPEDAATPLVTVEFQLDGIAYAKTSNRLPEGGAIETVMVVDGIGRVLQSKKTADVSTGADDGSVELGWTVSGPQRFDAMGRIRQQGLTFFEGGTAPGFNPAEPLHPTSTRYDAIGRIVEVRSPAEPDFTHQRPREAVTATTYDIAAPPGQTVRRLRTVVKDPNSHERVFYRSVADRLVAREERLRDPERSADVVTLYARNPVGELTSITDASGKTTTLEYDLLGQRTSLTTGDTGTTRFWYDAMGNLVRRQDANLAKRSPEGFVRYEYDFDHLVAIRYPEGSLSLDVKFEYGPPGAGENGAGRIVRIVDDAGEETRGYGKLGETKRTTRVLRPLKPLDPPLEFTTRFEYDAYGRMLSITYPDKETVSYAYDRGGLLRSASGDRAATPYYPGAAEQYLVYMAYDEFGQRKVARLGNGVLTKYAYYDETHRLKLVNTVAAGRLIQNLSFGYDLAGNVVGETNGIGRSTEDRSGRVDFTYAYDSLDRLKRATGTADARPGVTDEFETKYEYSDVHNMLRNWQRHQVTTVTDAGTEIAFPPHTNHDFRYEYANPDQPHRATRIGDTFLTYDWSGNTRTECRDHQDPTCAVNRDHFREYRWTEENRLAAVVHGGGKSMTRFVYDAVGERVVKFGSGGASVSIGQFFNMKGRTAATKHVFAGTARLASKLLPAGRWKLPTPSATGTVVTVSTSSGGTPTVVNNDNGCVPSDFQPQKCPIDPNGDPIVPPRFEDTHVRPETYYYHPGYLGSTAWVTDQNARVHEHVEYFPYGEIWREPKSDRDGAGVKGQRFLFSGKELDEETGLYYFGARYYDPVRARWASPDPEWLSQGTLGLNVYHYAGWNPIGNFDPDGRSWWTKAAKFAVKLYKTGDAVQALVDIGSDAITLFGPGATPLQRVGAGLSLASELLPVSIGDVKDVAKWAKKTPVGKWAAKHADEAGDWALKKLDDAGEWATKKLDKAVDAVGDATHRTERVPSKQLRRDWEEANGKTWPKDPDTGRNQDVAHKVALADGGTNDLSNYGPKPHAQHMQEHQDAGDFQRWGARAAEAKKKGSE